MIKKTILSSIIFLSAATATFAKSTSYVGGGLTASGYSQGQASISGFGATVFGGKGWYNTSEKLYLGAELGASLTRSKWDYNLVGINASLLPGVKLTEATMLYGRVGLTNDYAIKGSTVGRDNYTFSTQVGLGLQTKITNKWDARAEYTAFSNNRTNQIGIGLVYKLA